MRCFWIFFACVFVHVVGGHPPFILSSSKLIKGTVGQIPEPRPKPVPAATVLNIAKKLVGHCLSDAYVIFNQPGLQNDDFMINDQRVYYNLQKKLDQDSTVVSLPFVEPLQLDSLRRYLLKTCRVNTIVIDLSEEDVEMEAKLPHYLDTKPRLLIVNFPELTMKSYESRKVQLEKNDVYIRRIIGRLPTPHISIILTSLQDDDGAHERFMSLNANSSTKYLKTFKKLSTKYDPISFITHDKRRLNEEEIFKPIDYEKPKNRNEIARKNKHEMFLNTLKNDDLEISILNKDFLMKNEILVLSLVVVVISFFIYISVKVNLYFFAKLSQTLQKRKALQEKKNK